MNENYFYRGKPIPLERQLECVETLWLHMGTLKARTIERGWIVDQDDEAVKLAPQYFRRPAGPILTREGVN